MGVSYVNLWFRHSVRMKLSGEPQQSVAQYPRQFIAPLGKLGLPCQHATVRGEARHGDPHVVVDAEDLFLM